MALGDIADIAPERKRGGARIRRTDKNLSILRGKTSLVARRIKFLKLDLRGKIRTYTPCERFYASKIHRRERRRKHQCGSKKNNPFSTLVHTLKTFAYKTAAAEFGINSGIKFFIFDHTPDDATPKS
jgi:hypothetical protein